MIRFIDNSLLRIVGKIIKIGMFFGISRKQLVLAQMVIASFLHCYCNHTSIQLGITITGGILITVALLWFVMTYYYREDDILPAGPFTYSPGYRMFNLLWFLFLSVFVTTGFSPTLQLTMLKVLFPLCLWPWFILNQNTRCKITLRQLCGNGLAKLRTVFAPQAQPVPVGGER